MLVHIVCDEIFLQWCTLDTHTDPLTLLLQYYIPNSIDLENQEVVTTGSLLAPTPAEAALANSPAERRGSGFLLLAAEAYEAAERTQMRADAIRQVAMELAAASTSGATSAGITNPVLQQQYRDAILKSSASQFLQGLASSIRSSSDMAALPPEVEVDSNFREQVYTAAANMQGTENSLEAEKAEEGVGKVSSKAKSSPKQASNNSRKRKQSSAASASKKQSPRKRSSDIPPLPPAPLVMPKKKYDTKVPPAKIFQDAKKPPSNRTASGLPRAKPVKHVYHDYAAIPDSEEFERKKTGGVAMPFPEKLMNMLDKTSVLHPDTVSWCSHGRAFKVRKPKVFTNEVMGIYFKQSKLTSFQRQLNLYGFRRITQGEDAGAYYHELFLRGRPQLCMRMQRQKVKGTGIKQPTDITTEPNFYDMPPLGIGTTTAVATAEEGSEVANAVTMEEVSVFGGGAPMPSLFLLGNMSSSQAASSSAAASPFAPPDGQLNDGEMMQLKSSFRLGATSQTNSSDTPAMYEASPFTSEAATMLRRLSAPTVNAPPFGAPGTTTLPPSLATCANANAAAAAMTTLRNSKEESTKMEEV